jgi:hypothetical protein
MAARRADLTDGWDLWNTSTADLHNPQQACVAVCTVCTVLYQVLTGRLRVFASKYERPGTALKSRVQWFASVAGRVGRGRLSGTNRETNLEKNKKNGFCSIFHFFHLFDSIFAAEPIMWCRP